MRIQSKSAGVLAFVGAAVAFLLILWGMGALTDAKVGNRRTDVVAVLFSYPWETIAEQCETNLGPAGYGYVQTSPPQEHIEGSAWWVYYQPVSYQLESRMGDTEQFENMVKRCNRAGVGVIVDVVINHMTAQESGVGVAGTEFEKYNYPGLYVDADFHDCRKDILSYYVREEVQECNLVGLADLDTSSPKVQQTLADYLNTLVGMGVSGFRIDAAKHMAAEDIEGILALVDNRDDLYVVQEVIRAQNEPIQPEEYVDVADVQEFSYGRMIKEAFTGAKIDWLINDDGIGESWGYLPTDVAGVFVDNHDTERNGETLSYKDGKVYDLAQIFTLAWPYGVPAVQSGYAFENRDTGPVVDEDGTVVAPVAGLNGWTFKHAQHEIRNMVGWRGAAGEQPVTDKWVGADGNTIGFGRGDKAFVVINNSTAALDANVPTSVPDGIYYNLMRAQQDAKGRWRGDTITVKDGAIQAQLGAQEAVAFHIGAKASSECVPEGAPSAPGSLRATTNGGSIDLTWGESSNSCGIMGYVVTQTDGFGTTTTIDTTWPAATILASGSTDLTFSVQAADYEGELSPPSTEVTVAAVDLPTDTTVYYQAPSDWEEVNMHFKAGDAEWTDVPGEPMETAQECEGWYEMTVPAGSVEFVFNDGKDTWDNNNDQNYVATGPVAAVSGGALTLENPCSDEPLAQSGAQSVDEGSSNGWAIVAVVVAAAAAGGAAIAVGVSARKKRRPE